MRKLGTQKRIPIGWLAPTVRSLATPCLLLLQSSLSLNTSINPRNTLMDLFTEVGHVFSQPVVTFHSAALHLGSISLECFEQEHKHEKSRRLSSRNRGFLNISSFITWEQRTNTFLIRFCIQAVKRRTSTRINNLPLSGAL